MPLRLRIARHHDLSSGAASVKRSQQCNCRAELVDMTCTTTSDSARDNIDFCVETLGDRPGGIGYLGGDARDDQYIRSTHDALRSFRSEREILLEPVVGL